MNPEIFAARINRHEGTKPWDRILMTMFLLTEMAIPIVAALDDGRFHWLPVPWWVCVLGYALLIAGMVGFEWAESVNKFFEPTVRIQTDRGHKVIDTGPYAIVRHPGYVVGLPALHRHAPGSGFLVGIDPRHPVVPAPGPANDLGGPNPAGRVGGLRGVRSTSPISVDSWGLVIEPFHIPDMTTTLPHFSIPAQDETMAPLGSHE